MRKEEKYTVIYGNVLSSLQVKTIARYNKLIYIDDTLKRVENYNLNRSSSPVFFNYYLNENEDKHSVLQQHLKVNCLIYFNKQSSNGFNLWDWEEYAPAGELKFKGKKVFDNMHRKIFYCSYDLATNELEEGACKYFYANKVESEYEDMLLRFRYKSNGEFDEAVDIHDNFDFFKPLSLDMFLANMQYFQEDFRWDQHPYYHSVYPFLPEGPL